MRRILWNDYSPLWDKEVRKRPLSEVFKEIQSPGSEYRVPASYVTKDAFLRKVVGMYVEGPPGPYKFYQCFEEYGRGVRVVAGNLYSLLLLNGIILPPEELGDMTEYRTKDRTVYRYMDGRSEVIHAGD